MAATVEITESDGQYTAVDSETGTTGVGETRAMALAVLAVRLGAEEGVSTADAAAELRALGARVSGRFEEEAVTESDVEDAIAWARSE